MKQFLNINDHFSKNQKTVKYVPKLIRFINTLVNLNRFKNKLKISIAGLM